MNRLVLPIALITATIFSGCTNNNFLDVKAKAQTESVSREGDVADDPAIWIDHKNTGKSLVLGTNKKGGGLEIYDLNGKVLQIFKDGDFNNVDVRYDFHYDGKVIDIAVASNRTDDTMAVYGIDKEKNILFPLSLNSLPTLSESYGLCMHKSDDNFYVITNSKSGNVVMHKIEAEGKIITAKPVGNAKVPTQPEGCVVDDATQTLYLGEEGFGIWKFDISDGLKDNGVVFETIKNNPNLEADIEGLALYNNYLIASSQGNNSYAVYDKKTAKYLGSFVIGDGEFDGTSETDGIEATSVEVGSYKKGVFIAQDDISGKTQNFKIVDFEDILKGLKLRY